MTKLCPVPASSRSRRNGVTALVAVSLALFLTACVVLYGHRAEAPANGLTLAQLEAALSSVDGWSTRPVDGAVYRKRQDHLAGVNHRLLETARLTEDDGRIELHGYAFDRPDTAESRAWRERLDAIVSALDTTGRTSGDAEMRATDDHRPQAPTRASKGRPQGGHETTHVVECTRQRKLPDAEMRATDDRRRQALTRASKG